MTRSSVWAAALIASSPPPSTSIATSPSRSVSAAHPLGAPASTAGVQTIRKIDVMADKLVHRS
ncbi:MAG: hypothetical protein M3Z06_06460 [Actinomycetota bacterium]|nr:hypothetical protein [Actinomycetota bacterium]